MLYRPALHGNWNALSLARRALKDKFPTPTVPLTTVTKSSGISAGPRTYRLPSFCRGNTFRDSEYD
jgi:hypothetical protein